MAASDQPQPLDEIVWRSPPVAAEMGGIHTDSVLHYFSQSPFFDGTSNNATLSNQAMYNPSMFHLIQSRVAFEERLRSIGGLEFMVVEDPSEGGQKIDHSGVWVIRKQNRKKRPGMEDILQPLGQYYVSGENVYQAPTVGGIIESRMLSTANALTSFLSKASTLPLFGPAIGHTYLPPQPKPVNASTSSERGSFTGSVRASKENTPMPDTQGRGSSVGASDRPSITNNTNRRGVGLLAESLNLAMRYGQEYMDETPLVGEPGSFVIQKAKPSAQGSFMGSQPVGSQAKSGLSVKTDIAALVEDGDGEKTAGSKKGKGLEKSPISPLSPLTPGGGKKRKKSRSAQGAGSGGKVSAS